jgi:hypothetical protein
MAVRVGQRRNKHRDKYIKQGVTLWPTMPVSKYCGALEHQGRLQCSASLCGKVKRGKPLDTGFELAMTIDLPLFVSSQVASIVPKLSMGGTGV